MTQKKGLLARRCSKYLQTVACGCPGGSRGNAEISATRSLETPNTFPVESVTAMGSLRWPILPVWVIVGLVGQLALQNEHASYPSTCEDCKGYDLTSRRSVMNRHRSFPQIRQNLLITPDFRSRERFRNRNPTRLYNHSHAFEGLDADFEVGCR